MTKNTPVNTPFAILTGGLAVGVLLGYYFPVFNNGLIIYGLFFSILLLVGLKIWANKAPKKAVYFGLAICPVFCILGLFLVQLHNPLNHSKHYTQQLTNIKQPKPLLFKIQERLKPSAFYKKYLVTLEQTPEIELRGKILLYVKKDTLPTKEVIGQHYLTYTGLKEINKPSNPYQFDYAAYLKKQGIQHQIRVDSQALIPIKEGVSKTLKDHFLGFRTFLNQQLEKQKFSEETLAITKALLLGQRQDINPETYQNYANAGAIHLLAVSGLHIGILLWLFNLVLSPLLYTKKGKITRLFLVLLLLWAYACLTGLSPSVLRAATMFSFISIGQTIRFKKGNSYNALLTSAFVLLCFDPLLLFDVGFQLSYAAVFSIFWIQPMIAKGYTPRFFLDRLYWDTFTVTIAAQLGVLPLSIYYFHQFPLLFFVTNLAIVPLLGLVLGLGITVLLLAAIGKLPTSIATSFNFLIESMNSLIAWVAHKEAFLWSAISFSKIALIVSYLVLVSGIVVLKKFNPQRVYQFGSLAILFLSILIIEKTVATNQERLLLFHQYKNTLLAHHTGNQLTLHSRDSISEKTTDYILKPYYIAEQITTQSEASLKNAYRYKKQELVILDRSGLYPSTVQPDILLLTQSTKVHLDRVIDSLHPKQIIADGSNYPSDVRRWDATCKKRGIPFYDTAVSGAFVLE